MVFFVFQVVTFGYPRIKGPRSFDDRIVIVGGGMGGVHMASLLKVCIYTHQWVVSLLKVCIYNSTPQWVVFIWPPCLRSVYILISRWS